MYLDCFTLANKFTAESAAGKPWARHTSIRGVFDFKQSGGWCTHGNNGRPVLELVIDER